MLASCTVREVHVTLYHIQNQQESGPPNRALSDWHTHPCNAVGGSLQESGGRDAPGLSPEASLVGLEIVFKKSPEKLFQSSLTDWMKLEAFELKLSPPLEMGA